MAAGTKAILRALAISASLTIGSRVPSDGRSRWTLAVALMGLFTPAVFSGISTSYFTGLLGMLMLSMGITLTVDDFKRVLTKPGIMVLGFVGCYGLMPLLALGLSQAFGLSAPLTAGMVLVGSINGG